MDIEIGERSDADAGEVMVYRTGDIESLFACSECGEAFVPVVKDQATCGKTLCQSRRHWKRAKVDPRKQAMNVLRCQKHDRLNGRADSENLWLKRAPIYPSTYLPGGGFEIRISPTPRFPLTIENGRVLHGMITNILDVGHEQTDPTFALVPWPSGCGWGVYVWREDMVERINGLTVGARLDERQVTVTFSPVRRLRVPAVSKRGHRKLIVSTVTPVVIRRQVENGKRPGHKKIGYRTEPSGEALANAVGRQFIARLAAHLEDGPVRELFLQTSPLFDLVEKRTDPASVRLRKIRTIEGWEGSIVVDTNAAGEWLLRVAALVGLGGRCGFGFGRVRVEAREEAAPLEHDDR